MTIEGYKDANLTLGERVSDLLAKMTLEEKVQQMSMVRVKPTDRVFMKNGHIRDGICEFFGDLGIGGLQAPRDMPPKQLAVAINHIQDYLLNNTRLGIPAVIFSETLHGLMVPKATVFPQAIGLASTWNTELMGEISSAISKEARVIGIAQGLAPVLDLAREPRWGRTEETYGEDPQLAISMGVAYIKGLQGDYTNGIAATLKHFTAHGSPEGGLNLSPVSCGARQLRELFLPPFKAGVEAGALSVMAAYSEIDGIPCHASDMLLTTILREEWGFKGYTFCDYGALEMLIDTHRTAATNIDAAKQALGSGMDTEAPNVSVYGSNLIKMVKNGLISETLVNRAVSRILYVKFKLGLFEDPYADIKKVKDIVNCKKHKELALKAGHESVVMLKNNDKTLPIEKSIKRIGVIGPNANIAELGDYCIERNAVSPLQGIRNKISDKSSVIYTKGSELYSSTDDELEKALKVSLMSDIVILFLGGSSMNDSGIGWGQDTIKVKTSGEGFDVSDLDLPKSQQELARIVIQTGKPVVVVLINGRPASFGWIAERAKAVLYAWYPGEEGGNAIADIIFGDINPSGKLPISFPKSSGHIPSYYNFKPSARGYYKKPGSLIEPGRDYVFSDPLPLFEFGFGLSYTQFEYSSLHVETGDVLNGQKVKVRVMVKNIGNREGMQVVQLYINDVVSSVTTPVKALKGFVKVNLEPDEEREVEFILGPKELSLIDRSMKQIVEPGEFKVIVGNLEASFYI